MRDDRFAEIDAAKAAQQAADERDDIWTPFVRVTQIVQRGSGATMPVSATGFDAYYENNRYVVWTRTDPESGVLWLSIRRQDRLPIRDWRDLQRIKNDIAGPEREAVELFPAESRLVDTSNQFHLWVAPAGVRLPFGWNERLVLDDGEGPDLGHRQRPLPMSRAERRRREKGAKKA